MIIERYNGSRMLRIVIAWLLRGRRSGHQGGFSRQSVVVADWDAIPPAHLL